MPRKRRKTLGKHKQFLKDNRHRYEELLAEQGGVCAICKRPPSERRKLDMDHDHKEMFLRGLLCHRCNRTLVSWINADWLLSAAAYLQKGAV